MHRNIESLKAAIPKSVLGFLGLLIWS